MRRRAQVALAAALAAGFVPGARAGGPTVGAGTATISTSGSTTTINQTSPRGVYIWPSLNLPAGNTLQFNEPTSASIAINRVTSGAAIINGSILSNGQVWIIDPAGVMFGRGSSVNVAGLIATTSDIAGGDLNFVNGTGPVTFGTPTANAAAAIVNNGSITIAAGGAAVLAGARVVNNGMIEADLGKVVLAGADTFTVDFTGDKLISFAIGSGVSHTPLDRDGNPAAALVANAGTIRSEGGEVLLTARATRSVLTNVLNTSGMIEATSAHEENGEIVLDAGDGAAEISGTLDVSGKAAGATGGTVTATGASVTVAAGTRIDVSGDAGGGSVALGGDFHGAGPLANATSTTIAAGAVINASAITSGDGGRVAVWSNGTTVFDGTILATGAAGGRGGYVETSGEGVLTVGSGASVITSAGAGGASGTWLLDPANILVESADGGVTSLSGNTCGFADGTCSIIDPTAIDNAGSNVTLQATNGITFNSPIVMANTGAGITATADGSITVNFGATITTKGGAVNMTANSSTGGSPTGSGSITIGANIATDGGGATGGGITLGVSGGTGTLSLGANLVTQGGAISLNAPTVASASVTIDTTDNFADAAGANVTFSGTVNDATANTHQLSVTSGDYEILFNGAIGGSHPFQFLQLNGGGAGVSGSATGIDFEAPVTLGSGGANIQVNQKVIIDAAITESSGSGNLNITAGDSDSLETTPRPDEIVFGPSGLINFAGSSGSITINYHPSTFPFDDVTWSSKVTPGAGGFSHYMSITSAADLELINTNLAGDFAIGSNTIDLSSVANWAPLGSIATPFTGILNGETGVIANLTINDGADTAVGLFGAIGSGGVVENLALVNANVIGTAPSADVGAFVGNNNGTLSYVSSSGTVNGSNATHSPLVGGLVGLNDGTVANSYSTANASGGGVFVTAEVGGLAGGNSGAINQSYATGAVSNGDDLGGLVGFNYGTISQSYANGAVTGGAASTAGGLVGANDGSLSHGTISVSYASGLVSAPGAVAVGGLVALNQNGATVTSSYWDTVTSGQASSAGGSGLSTTQMASVANESTNYGASWNFSTTWYLVTGMAHPILQSELGPSAPSFAAVSSAHQLELIGLDAATESSYYYLINDIGMSELTNPSGPWLVSANASIDGGGYGFVPVQSFGGTLNGSGFKITGLTINDTADASVGLIGTINSGASVSNLGLVGGSVTGTSTANASVGFLAGANNGTISGSYATGLVTATGGNNASAGGLVGSNNGAGTIANSYATGAVSNPNGYVAGGLAGGNGGTISQSYATGTVTGLSNYADGGLVGFATGGTISQSFATGAVSGSYYAGGLLGISYATITDAYATGAVSGSGDIGGLIGLNEGTTTSVFAAGLVTATGTPACIGGLIGCNGGTVTSSYWDTSTSGQATSAGGGTGLATASLQGTLPAGFSDGSWAVLTSPVASYPYLISIFSTAPQVVTGAAYSAIEVNPIAGEILAGQVNGTSFGEAVTGANGSYYFLLPSGTIPATNGQVIVSAVTGGLHYSEANVFADNADGSASGLDLNGTGLRLLSSGAFASGIFNDLATAVGSGGTGINFTLGVNNVPSLPAGQVALSLVTSAPTLTLDVPLNLGTTQLALSDRVGGVVQQTQPFTTTGLTLFGAGATFTLANPSNSFSSLAANTGSANIADASSFEITSLGPPASPTAGATLTGNLTITDTATVTQNQPISAAGLALLGAGGTYTLTTATNSIGTLAANTGSLTLDATGTVTIAPVGGTSVFTASGATAVTANSIAFGASANVTIADFASFTASTGGISEAEGATIALTNSGGGAAFIADSISLSALASGAPSITGSGIAVLFGLTPATTIGVGAGAGTLSLSQATLNAIGTPLQIGTGAPDQTGLISIAGGVTFTGNTTIFALGTGGQIDLSGTIKSKGQPVLFQGPVVLTATSTTVDTTDAGANPSGGTVTFQGTLDGNGGASFFLDNLTVTAGAGDIDFTGRVGYDGTSAGSDLSAVSPGAVSLTTTGNVNLTMPVNGGLDGLSAASFSLTGPAATLTASNFISTHGESSGSSHPDGGPLVIDTTGNVSIAGSLNSGGGFNSVTPATGGHGGAITVDATSGTVAVGTLLTSSTVSVLSTGYSAGASSGVAGQGAGAGGSVSITGTSITIGTSIIANGGAATFTGAVGAGGSGGNVTLTATNGGVTIGESTSPGNLPASIAASGGTTNAAANGGTAGSVTITASAASGNISLAASIVTPGGEAGGSGTSGNGGAVTVSAGGTVSIGSSLFLVTQYSGNELKPDASSILTRGGETYTSSSTPGNGGEIQVSGTSVTLPFGTSSGGGEAVDLYSSSIDPLGWALTAVSGWTGTASTANGGNAAPTILTATSGAVTIGNPAGSPSTSTGAVIGVFARGGDSTGGNGGAGANITISGNTISLARAGSFGGDTLSAAGTGGAGGNLSLTATSAVAGAITLYGNNDPATTSSATLAATLSARGGFSDMLMNGFGNTTAPATTSGAGGTLSLNVASGGTIVLATSTPNASGGTTATTGTTTNGSNVITSVGSTAGLNIGEWIEGPGIPVGAAIVSFPSSTSILINATVVSGGTVGGPITALQVPNGVNDGATVGYSAAGGLGHGGAINVTGPIEGAIANSQTLHLFASDGAFTTTGAVGDLTSLANITIGNGAFALPSGGSGGSYSFGGAATVGTTVTDLAPSGSLVFDGLLTTPAVSASGSSVAILGGAVFSNSFSVASSAGTPLDFGGHIVFDTTLGGSVTGTIVLASATTLDFSAASGGITIGGTIDSIISGPQAFIFDEPTGGATINAALGGTNALGAVTVNGTGPLTLSSTTTTAGGAVTLNSPVKISGVPAIDTTNNGHTAAGANITFNSTLDGTSPYSDNLRIHAGSSGNVTFGNVGASIRLGTPIISNANAVDFTGIVNIADLTVGSASFTTASNINAVGPTSTTLATDGGTFSIVTSGAVTIGGGIIASGGLDGTAGGNGGSVTINAGGAVSIGSAITLTTSGSGSTLVNTSSPAVVTNGFSATTATQTAGNAGGISITGGSVTLAQSVVANGGNAAISGSSANGGNASTINITATSGSVTIGSAATGDLIGVFAGGGNSFGGTGGMGSNVTISGQTITLAKVTTNAGDSALTSAATAKAAGNITLNATKSSGDAVVLLGNAASAALAEQMVGTLTAIGGEYNDTNVTTAGALANGTITGAGGKITIESSSGVALNGTADIRLQDNSANSAINGGPTVNIVAPGGLSTGGTILINGPVVGTTANIENLRVSTANGVATLRAVGTGAIPLGTFVLGTATNVSDTLPSGSNDGSFTITGAVTINTLDITAASGGVTFNGFVTGVTYTPANPSIVTFSAGSSFSGGGGEYIISSPLVLSSDDTINSGNEPIIVNATIDDSTAGADTLTLDAGTSTVTINDPLGGTTPLGAITIIGSLIDLGSNVTTKAGAVTFNGPVVLTRNVAINTAALSSAGANVSFNGTLDAQDFLTETLSIAAGTAGTITFAERVGAEQTDTPTAGCTCSSPGALTITSAAAIDMSMPFGNADGVSVGALSITGVASVTDTSFISTAGTQSGSGGAVTISASGAVAIGSGIPLFVSGADVESEASIDASGFSTSSAGTPAGNGAAVTVTAASINVPFGIDVEGGSGKVAGTPVNGGNGGTITLTATGAIDAGSVLAGPQMGLEAAGGASFVGNGGNGGTITATGLDLLIAGADSSAGNTQAGAPKTGGQAGNITFIATASSGAAVVLYGTSNSATGIVAGPAADLLAVGGIISDPTAGTDCGCIPTGTVNGAGGNITIEGSAGGAALAGSAFIELQTSTSTAFGGATVLVVAPGGSAGTGGTVSFNGPVQATTANVENLHVEASNGSFTVTGPVGTATALGTLAFGFAPGAIPSLANSGAMTFDGAVTVGTAVTDLRTAGSLTFDGKVTTPSFAMTAGATSLAMTGGASFTGRVSLSGGATSLAGTFTFSGAATGFSDSGTITLTGATTLDTSAVNRAVSLAAVNGTAVLAPFLTITAGTGAVTFTGAVGGGSAVGAVDITGGTLTLDGITSTGSVIATSAGSAAITLEHSISAAGTVALTAGGNLTLDAGATVTGSSAGNAVVLATGGVFDNLAGAGGIVANGGGRWLVWSQNPASDTVGGLPFAFKQYDAIFGVTTPAGTGDGLLYALAPSVTASLTGSVVKTYDATTAATLAPANYTITGSEPGDSIVLNDPASGTYASANAGSSIVVTATGVSIVSASSGGAPVFGYTLTSSTAVGAVGTINRRPVVLSGARTFDNTANAAAGILTITNDLDGTNLTLSGTGALASANAGTESFASASTLALGGSAAGNYTLVGITTNGSSVTVGQLPVILSGTKTYDATTGAPAAGLTITNNLSGANLTLSGSGTLASANAGSESFAGAGTFALGGSAAGNYTLSAITTNGSAVTVNPLPVVLTGTRTYDATTAAATASSALAITNDLDGTNLTLSGTGTLASANAGSEHFAAIGTLALGGSAASNYTLSGITTNASAVTVGQLPVILSGTKTFDATTGAPAAALAITNDLSGASLTLSGTGTLAGANVGSEGFAGAGTLTLGGSAAGNYTLASITTNGSAVTVNPLAVVLSGARAYDTTTSAPAAGLTITNDLSGASLTLSGTGTLASANAGVESFASAGTLTLGGSAAGNYTLASITTNGSAVTVSKLPVVLTGMRVYDATTAAATASSALTITNDLDGTNLTLSGTGTLASANAGTESFASASTLALGGSAAGNYTLVGITTNGSSVTVGQLPVILSGAKTYDATTGAPAAGLTITNNLSGANLTLSGSGTLASANAGSESFAGAGTFALGGSAAGNYTLSSITTNGSAVTVGKLPVVLTGMRVYDATTAADTASSALAITNDLDGTNLTLSGTGTLASANAGSEHFAALGTLLLGGSAASNYTTSGITTNGSAVSITPATLTYTANPASGLSGAPIPPLSGTVPATEFKGSDTLASATTGTLVFTTMATPASGAGSYAINGSGLSANFGNYVFVQAAANATALTLGGSQTVTGDVFSDHGVSALTGASIGLVLGGTNEGTVTSGAGGAYEFVLPAGTISPSGTGLFVFIASGPVTGNSFYNAATSSLTGLDIYGNVFRVLNAPPSLMQTGTALAATLGSISNPARFLFTLGGGGAIGLGGSNFELAGPAPFTIDETVSAASFAVTAGGITLADNVTTTGAQTYSGSVTVPGPGVTLAGSNVTFTSAIEGPGTLAINGPGTVTLGGPVGDVVPLGGLTVTAGTTVLGAGIWTSSGIVMLRSNVTLTQNTMIDTDGAGADIDLMGPVSGSAYTLTLEPGVGDVTLSGVSVGGLVFMPSAPALVTLDSGSYTIAGGAYTFGAVDLDGSLSFGEATSFGPATVIGPSTITSPGAPITFTSTLMGSGTTLSIEPGTGAVSYAEMPVGVTVINVPPPSTSTAPPASDVDAVDSGSSTASGASTGTTGTSETGTTSTSDSGTSDTSGTTTSGTTTASTGTPAPTGGATGDVISDETATLLNALAPAAGPTAAPSGAGPLEILTDSSTSTDTSVGAGGGTTASVVVVTANAFTVTTTGTGEAAAATAASLSQQTAPGAETDSAADSIANSLGGTPGAPAAPGASQSGKPVTLVNGVLSQTPAAPGNACSGGTSTAAACKPHSVPPADQEYSSWGNEAFWQ